MVVQNWLAKNPYYIVSYAAEENQSNGGGGDRGDRLHRDYLWDRPDIQLSMRQAGTQWRHLAELLAREAYERSNELAIARMNGYRVTSQAACVTSWKARKTRLAPSDADH